MPRYLIIHAERRREDALIEDPELTVEFADGWVLFRDRDLIRPNRVVLAIPAAQVARVERVDEDPDPEDQKPALHKE